MNKKSNIQKSRNFYKDFHETNPSFILGLIIISLGLYIINWIYTKNRDFEYLDKFAPNANRGAIIMMILPFGWFFITYISKKLIFNENNLIIGIIEIVGWGFIIFLLLKYIIDFCLSFGRITNTRGILWFFPFLITILGVIIGIMFKLYILLVLIIIPAILVLAMQAELNLVFIRFKIKKDRHTFYH